MYYLTFYNDYVVALLIKGEKKRVKLEDLNN